MQFRAGQLSLYLTKWQKITSDQHILDIVSGDKIDFIHMPPKQIFCPPNSICKDHFSLAMKEIMSLLTKGVIVRSKHESGEFISPIFTVPKPDGNVRLILNLKRFNESVQYAHFKMETIHSIINLVTPGCWMASLDLKDAYYSVKIHPKYQKFLKFKFEGQLYQYTTYANGLSSCPRKFTKLLKPPLSKLRLQNHIVSAYIDDLYLQSATYQGCVQTVVDTFILFDDLGFVIHPDKSQFTPKQQLTFLGFVIDSVTMRVFLTDSKRHKVYDQVNKMYQTKNALSIEYVAQIIGYIVSSLPGVQFGALYYRWLEMEKAMALKLNKGNFKAMMSLSDHAKIELKWWLDNILTCYRNIVHAPITAIVYSDASLLGWGAAMNGTSTGGRWSAQEATHHINYLELLAAFLALKVFRLNLSDRHVKVMIDNTAAVCIINNMGTCRSKDCHLITVKIWEFCIEHNIWLTAAHLPGSTNVIADSESRNFCNLDTEWMLNPTTLRKALSSLDFEPEIDLFASRLNKQFSVFCSYRPDPDAKFINAFSICWSGINFYCFPPFSCVLQTLQKIRQEKARGVMVVPKWPSQSWYPILSSMIVHAPVVLNPSPNHLSLPGFPGRKHPLYNKMTILVCLLSGKN